MPQKPDFYENTNYRKVMFVIDKDVYAAMRAICDKDSKRVIKAGDLIKIMTELIAEHVPPKVQEAAYEAARVKEKKLTARDITKAIPTLSAAQRDAIEKIIAAGTNPAAGETLDFG